MGVTWRKTSALFRCDIPGCYAEHTERFDPDWNESRAAAARAADLGWRIGQDKKAMCPDCSMAGSSYYDDDGLP
jgi:hypothetical protein